MRDLIQFHAHPVGRPDRWPYSCDTQFPFVDSGQHGSSPFGGYANKYMDDIMCEKLPRIRWAVYKMWIQENIFFPHIFQECHSWEVSSK
jgi:hypothetical protein